MESPGHCTITTTLHDFRSCSREQSAHTEYDCDSEDFKENFDARFYANGSCTENEGHVSIIFNVNPSKTSVQFHTSAKFACVASIIDASGNKRFHQTFAKDFDFHSVEDPVLFAKGFGFDKYIKRSELLSYAGKSELLPNDSLALCLEIAYETGTLQSYRSNYDEFGFDFEKDGKIYLRMYSEFGRDLWEMSNVFLDMMESRMEESVTGRVIVPPEEIDTFLFLFVILSEENIPTTTIVAIHNLYMLADKYDMQQIIQTCHQFLISMMRAISTREILEHTNIYIHMIFELSERFDYDKSLKDILKVYSDIKCKFNGGTPELEVSNTGKLETEWNCEYLTDVTYQALFVFSKIKREYLQMDFYK